MARYQIQNGLAHWHLEPATMEIVVTPDFSNACLTRTDLVAMLKTLDGESHKVRPDLIEVKTRLKETIGGRWLT